MKKIVNNSYHVLVITFVLVVLAIVTCVSACRTNPLLDDYHNLTKDHRYVNITADEALELIQSTQDYVLVMGFKECPWCQQLLPVVDSAAKEVSLPVVYYLDILKMRNDETSPDHPIYLQIKKFARVAVDVQMDRINAPTVLFVKNQVIMAYHIDTLPEHQMSNNVLPKLTAEQTARLQAILVSKMELIK